MNNNKLIALIDEIIITIKSVLTDYKSGESCKEFKRLEEINIDAYKLMQDIKKINNETNEMCNKFENENLFLKQENKDLQDIIDNQNKQIYNLEGSQQDYLYEKDLINKKCKEWEDKYKYSLYQLNALKEDYCLLEEIYNEYNKKSENKYNKLNDDYNTLKEEYDELCDLYRVTLVRQFKKEIPERKHNNSPIEKKHNNSPIEKIENPWNMSDANSLH